MSLCQFKVLVVPCKKHLVIESFVKLKTRQMYTGPLYLQGDSGGPLACKDQQGTWTVIGINSFILLPCIQSILARVSTYVDWIDSTISSYV